MNDQISEGSFAFGVIVGAIVAVVLALFLSYLGVVIGGAVGVKIVGTSNMKRALLVGAGTGVFSGIVAILLLQSILPAVLTNQIQNLPSTNSTTMAEVTKFAPAFTAFISTIILILYFVAAIIGAAIGKAFWIGDTVDYASKPGPDWYAPTDKNKEAPPKY